MCQANMMSQAKVCALHDLCANDHKPISQQLIVWPNEKCSQRFTTLFSICQSLFKVCLPVRAGSKNHIEAKEKLGDVTLRGTLEDNGHLDAASLQAKRCRYDRHLFCYSYVLLKYNYKTTPLNFLWKICRVKNYIVTSYWLKYFVRAFLWEISSLNKTRDSKYFQSCTSFVVEICHSKFYLINKRISTFWIGIKFLLNFFCSF